MKRFFTIILAVFLLLTSVLTTRVVSAEGDYGETDDSPETVEVPEEDVGEEESPDLSDDIPDPDDGDVTDELPVGEEIDVAVDEIREDETDEDDPIDGNDPGPGSDFVTPPLTYIDEKNDLDLDLLKHEDYETQSESMRATIPASYSLKDQGYVTSVKNQNPYGTCWTFAAMASAESGLLKKYNQTRDLAELQLAYYNFNSYQKADQLGLITNDGVSTTTNAVLDIGGNIEFATMALASGIGFSNESIYPYNQSNAQTYLNGNGSGPCYNTNYRLRSVRWLNMSEKDTIKTALMNYGAIATSYFHSDSYLSRSSSGDYVYCQKATNGTNHAVTIVGWNDNFSKDNFTGTYKPDSNGAWLIKNSWGTGWGNSGYFWISYEDLGIKDSMAAFYEAEIDSAHDPSDYHFYQYDGSDFYHTVTLGSYTTLYMSNVYTTVNQIELLQDVGFFIANPGTSYVIQIYTNVGSTPTSGTLAYTKSGNAADAGYYLIHLDEKIKLTQGLKYSVVVKLTNTGVEKLSLFADMTYNYALDSVTMHNYNAVDNDLSYYSLNGSSWGSFTSQGFTARIKAVTQCSNIKDRAYALLKSNGDFVFFRSYNDYSNNGNSTQTVKDINGASYEGIVYPDVEISAYSSASTVIWNSKRSSIKNVYVVSGQSVKPANTSYWFENCTNLTSFNDDGFDMSNVSDMQNMFKGCSSLTALDISGFVTSRVPNMKNLFYGCSALKSLDISGFVVNSGISSMQYMFDGCSSLNSVVLGSNFKYWRDNAYLPQYTWYHNGMAKTYKELYQQYPNNASSWAGRWYFILVTSVTLNKTSLNMKPGDTETLSASVQPSDATNKNLTWTSSNTSVATVDSNGKVTAVAEGTAVITAKAKDESGKKATCNVTVSTPVVATTYKVRHYLQALDNTYVLNKTETFDANSGTQVTPDTLSYEGFTAPSKQTVTVAADGSTAVDYRYARNSYNVNIVKDSHIASTSGGGSHKFESSVTLSAVPAQGYVCRWEGEFDSLTFNMPARNVTMFVYGDPIHYTIRFDLNGVDGSIDDLSAAYGESVQLPPVDAPANLEFKGWAYSADGSIAFTDGQSVSNLTAEDGAIVVLYARWDYRFFAEKPNASPGSGSQIEKYDEIFLSCATQGADIYYTTNGSDPKTNGVLYGDPIVADDSTMSGNTLTIKAYARAYQYKDSDVVTFTYTVKPEDFGDILEEDRISQGIITVKDIPTGIWTSKPFGFDYDPSVKSYTFAESELRVYYGKKMLKAGSDYSVKYAKNTKAGTASVTVTGKGNYAGTLTKNFEIRSVAVTETNVTVALSKDAFVYNGKVQKPSVTVKYGNVTLKNKTDYAVTFPDRTAYKDPGVYNVTVTFKGNYEGELCRTYEIVEKNTLIPVSSAKISGVNAAYEYTGMPWEPVPVLSYKNEALEYGIDYEVTGYLNNVDPGTATIILKGKGSFTGTVRKTFKIKGYVLSAKTATVDGLAVSVPYSGAAITQDAAKVFVKGKDDPLIPGTDYTVSYKNNVNAGTATVTFKGISGYEGSFSKTFKITALAMNDVSKISVDPIPAQKYLKGGIKALPVVRFNGVSLSVNKDYTLTYKNNAKVGTATVTIKGKGNFSGSVSETFVIEAKDLSELMAPGSLASVTAQDKIYSTKANAWKSVPVLKDNNGKKLVAGTDYEKTYSYDISGEAVTGVPQFGTVITVTVTGKGNYSGTASATYRIVKSSIAKAKVTIPAQYYTGKAITLGKDDIKVKIGKETLSGSDYDIVSYENNVLKGTATVVIRGKGNYGGIKNATFKIKSRSFGITIRFDGNGATSGSMKDQLIYKNTALTKKAFVRKGYAFEGWSLTPGGDVKYTDRQVYVYDIKDAGEIIVLYAKWKDINASGSQLTQ